MNPKSPLPKSVTTLTPLRISFMGGGTDLPGYYKEHGGGVVSTAIDKYIQVTVKRHSYLFEEAYRLSYSKTEHVNSLEEIENDIARECLRLIPVEPPLYIGTIADLPASSGLGSSSSFAVGLLHALHALRGERVTPAQLAEEACEVEINILRNPIGKQDQYAAAFGGLNHIVFKQNGRVEIDHLVLQNHVIDTLFSNSVLVWTGMQRSASSILEKQSHQVASLQEKYAHMTLATGQLKNLFLHAGKDFLAQFGDLLSKAWEVKKSLEHSISSGGIDQLHAELIAMGSLGGKLCGAGGGGFLFEVMNPRDQAKIINQYGLNRVIKFGYEPVGTRLISEIY
jgi:D-glycero-alpha-D-manno-heptose-7-phosphate kinase